MILNACRSVESARSPPIFFFTTLATLTPPRSLFAHSPTGAPTAHRPPQTVERLLGSHSMQKEKAIVAPCHSGHGAYGGGLPGTSSPTPAISLAPSKLGACWNPAHSRLGSSWHTDALPPQLPCAWPELSHPRAARRFRLMAPHGTTSQHPRSTAPPCTAAPHCTWSSAPAHLLCAHPAPHLC